MILLDTNVIIDILRGNRGVAQKFAEHVGDLAIPAMVLGELFYGIERSSNPAKNKTCVFELVETLPVMHTNDGIMKSYGMARAMLARNGEIVEDADLLIAATAMFYDAVLVTSNIRHFSRFPGLKIENWRE